MLKLVTDIPLTFNKRHIFTTKKRLKLKKIKKIKKRNNNLHSNQVLPELNGKENKINILIDKTDKNPLLNKKTTNDNDKSPFKINPFGNIEKSPNLFNELKDKDNEKEVNNHFKLFDFNKLIKPAFPVNNNIFKNKFNSNISSNNDYDFGFDESFDLAFSEKNNNKENNNQQKYDSSSPFKIIHNINIQINNINTPSQINSNNFNVNNQAFPTNNFNIVNISNNSNNPNRQNNINNNDNYEHPFLFRDYDYLNTLHYTVESVPFHMGTRNTINRDLKNIKNKLNKTKIKKVLELDENKKNCIICFEDFKINQNIYILPCSHIFHVCCFNKEVKLRQKCPNCRENI